MYLDLNPVAGPRLLNGPVTTAHFGANYLFNREAMAEGIGPDGGFDELARSLSVGHLRYPGGTVAETQFLLANPELTYQPLNLVTGETIANTAQHHLTPLSEFLTMAADMKARVTIVLPTAQFRDAILSGNDGGVEGQIKAFIVYVMSLPTQGWIEAIELGNEWATWFDSAAEYGRVADKLAVWVAEAMQVVGKDAMIAVQASNRAARLNETDEIIAQLSEPARAAIDAVTIHNYRTDPWNEGTITTGKVDHVERFEAALGRDLTVMMTEWNVANGSVNDGLPQAAGLLEMMWQQVNAGVDIAHVWPLLENTSNTLADDVTDLSEAAALRSGGEIFYQMRQSLPGAHALNMPTLIDFDQDGTAEFLVHAWEHEDGLVAFVSSLIAAPSSLDLDLADLSAHATDFDHLWLTRMGAATGSDPTAPSTLPIVTRTAADPGNGDNGVVSLQMGAYQVTRIEFARNSARFQQDGDGVDALAATAASDVIVLADDGVQDSVKYFDPTLDRLDVSALGIRSMEDMELRDLYRANGTVSWIELTDYHGESELLLRLAGTATAAEALDESNFIFGTEDVARPDAPLPDFVADTAGYDELWGTGADEIFAFGDDGIQDVLKAFDPEVDRIDISATGARSMDEIVVTDLIRANGTVAWVAVEDPSGETELIMRFAGGALTADRLNAENFVFADPNGPEVALIVEDTVALDDLRGTARAEIFVMSDDGQRDSLRHVEHGLDRIDVSSFAADFGDLTLTDLVRPDGSVNWIEVSDAEGTAQFLMRLLGVENSADSLSEADFIF